VVLLDSDDDGVRAGHGKPLLGKWTSSQIMVPALRATTCGATMPIRTDAAHVKRLGALGVATVHEAYGGFRLMKSLRELGFRACLKAISAKGTVKATLGAVNVPVVCAGWLGN
jgi:hypothetical protein